MTLTASLPTSKHLYLSSYTSHATAPYSARLEECLCLSVAQGSQLLQQAGSILLELISIMISDSKAKPKKMSVDLMQSAYTDAHLSDVFLSDSNVFYWHLM